MLHGFAECPLDERVDGDAGFCRHIGDIPVLGVLGLLVLTPALICSVNGRRSRRRGVATAGLVISVISIALVIFETIVWFEILRG